MEKIKIIFILIIMVSGCTTANRTFVLPSVTTYPEERQVANKAPVIPVIIQK